MDPLWESTPIPCGPADTCQAQSPSDCKSTGWSRKHRDQLIPKQSRGKDPSLWRSLIRGSAPPAPKPVLMPEGSAVPIPPCPDLPSHLSHPIPAHPGACRGCQHPLETDFPHFRGISDPFPKARRIPKGRTPMILPPASHSGSRAKFQSCHLPFPRRKAKFIPCLQLLGAQGNESSPGSCAGHSNSPNK